MYIKLLIFKSFSSVLKLQMVYKPKIKNLCYKLLIKALNSVSEQTLVMCC